MGRRPTLFQYLNDPDAYPSVTFRPDPVVPLRPQAVPRRGTAAPLPRTRMAPTRMGTSSSLDLASQAGMLADDPTPAPHVPFSAVAESPGLLFPSPPGSEAAGGPMQSPAKFAPPDGVPGSWDMERDQANDDWRTASMRAARREAVAPYVGYSNLAMNGLTDEQALLPGPEPQPNPLMRNLFGLVYGRRR